MAKKKGEEKLPKYFDADEKVRPILEKVVRDCSDTFNAVSAKELKLLFTGEKYKAGRKPIRVRFIRQPYEFISRGEKAFVLINFEYWDTIIDSERIKILIEALLGIMTDDNGEYVKRDYDIQSYRELIKDPEEDFSRFGKVLPAEVKRVPDLELT